MSQKFKRTFSFLAILTMLLSLCVFTPAATAEGARSCCTGHYLKQVWWGIPGCVNSQDELHLCENNFPDKNFRNYLKDAAGYNGYFNETELKQVNELQVGYMSITSLQGIEFFPFLTELDCSGNLLTELELSDAYELTYLDCNSNQLTELRLSGLWALTELNCSENELTAPKLYDLPVLEALDCSMNQLTDLNLKNFPALSLLYCSDNLLTELDLAGLPGLMELDCSGNLLTELDLSKLPALMGLECSWNQLTKLDLSKLPGLMVLGCSANLLTELDLSKVPELMYLDCAGNQLTALDLSKVPALFGLACDENQLTGLDLSKCPDLLYLFCAGNQLAQLDLSGITSEIYYGEISPQEIELPLIQKGNSYVADLSKVISAKNLGNVTCKDGTYDPKTGSVVFNKKIDSFSYDYNTKAPDGEAMTVIVTISELKTPGPAAQFPDVDPDQWYMPYLNYAVENHILNGYNDGTLKPNRAMTRAEFVQVLANLSGVDTSNRNVKTNFPDVAAGQWYAPAVKWASDLKLVMGDDKGNFNPNSTMTREQMCIFLTRYVENVLGMELKPDSTQPKFNDDAQISFWAKDYVYRCQQTGLVMGKMGSVFDPQASSTRAEVATVLTRLANL